MKAETNIATNTFRSIDDKTIYSSNTHILTYSLLCCQELKRLYKFFSSIQDAVKNGEDFEYELANLNIGLRTLEQGLSEIEDAFLDRRMEKLGFGEEE